MRLTKEQMEQQLKDFWVSRREAAQILGKSGEWVYSLARRGRIEYLDTSIGQLYSKEDVEKIAQQGAERQGQ